MSWRSFPERRSRHPVDGAHCPTLGTSSDRVAPNRPTDHAGGPLLNRGDSRGGGLVAGHRGVIGERQLRQWLGSVGGLLDQHRDRHIQRNRPRHRHRSLQRDDHGPGVRGDLQPGEHRRWLPDGQLLGDGGGVHLRLDRDHHAGPGFLHQGPVSSRGGDRESSAGPDRGDDQRH